MPHDRSDHGDEASEGHGDDASDDTAADDGPVDRPVDRIRRSTAGGMLAAGMLGLQEALEGRPAREEIVVVSEASGEPTDDPLSVELDFDDPTRSRVVVRREPDDT